MKNQRCRWNAQLLVLPCTSNITSTETFGEINRHVGEAENQLGSKCDWDASMGKSSVLVRQVTCPPHTPRGTSSNFFVVLRALLATNAATTSRSIKPDHHRDRIHEQHAVDPLTHRL